jgi:hypothetical protein
MCRAAAVEGVPSEVVPGEDTTERMRVRAAAAEAPAWDLEAEAVGVVAGDLEAEAAGVVAGEAVLVVAEAGGVVAGDADERRKLRKGNQRSGVRI